MKNSLNSVLLKNEHIPKVACQSISGLLIFPRTDLFGAYIRPFLGGREIVELYKKIKTINSEFQFCKHIFPKHIQSFSEYTLSPDEKTVKCGFVYTPTAVIPWQKVFKNFLRIKLGKEIESDWPPEPNFSEGHYISYSEKSNNAIAVKSSPDQLIWEGDVFAFLESNQIRPFKSVPNFDCGTDGELFLAKDFRTLDFAIALKKDGVISIISYGSFFDLTKIKYVIKYERDFIYFVYKAYKESTKPICKFTKFTDVFTIPYLAYTRYISLNYMEYAKFIMYYCTKIFNRFTRHSWQLCFFTPLFNFLLYSILFFFGANTSILPFYISTIILDFMFTGEMNILQILNISFYSFYAITFPICWNLFEGLFNSFRFFRLKPSKFMWKLPLLFEQREREDEVALRFVDSQIKNFMEKFCYAFVVFVLWVSTYAFVFTLNSFATGDALPLVEIVFSLVIWLCFGAYSAVDQM